MLLWLCLIATVAAGFAAAQTNYLKLDQVTPRSERVTDQFAITP